MSTESIVSFASLILADAGAEISAESILNVIKAAGADVDAIWAEIYAKALAGKDVKEILSGFNTVGASAGPASGAAAVGSADAAVEEEAVEEEAEESDDDMGFGLFD